MEQTDDIVMTIRMPRELHSQFVAAVRQNDLRGAQVFRELAREYVRRHAQGDLFREGRKAA